MSPLWYNLVFLVPLGVITGYLIGGAYTFLTPFIVFVLIPLLDLVVGKSERNPTEEEERKLTDRRAYRIITWICAPVQVGLVAWGAWVVGTGSLAPLEFVGFTISVGVSSGILGINVSHELAHRVKSRLEVTLSRVMLSTVLYMHWALEHVAGHHANVATPNDPATARFGETFWAFLPRTVGMGFAHAWDMEAKRLERSGAGPWSPKNRVLRYLAIEVLILLAVMLLFGPLATAFFITQGAIAIGLLEIVNYVEHYGMRRAKTGSGRYEPVRPIHSWNSSNILTNAFLFNLERHSDHHYKPGRRYQLLRHFEESPQLPTGYAGMLLLAAVPPLWFRVMDPKVRRHHRENGYGVPAPA
ncbi:MAG: alkane 1-monooxygenase [Desulfatibacillaceae bacterium]